MSKPKSTPPTETQTNQLTLQRIWLYFVRILIVEILEYELSIMDKAVDAELKMSIDYQL